MTGDCKDRALAEEGRRRIEWAAGQMPVLRQIMEDWERELPLKGLRIAACLHVTTETANLMRTLKAGGAEVALCASNPLSTQDDTAAALNEVYRIPTYAIRGEDSDTYYRHIHSVLDIEPHLTMDDGADLVNTLHGQRQEFGRRDPRRHRGDDDGRDPAQGDGGEGRPQVSGHRRQRCDDQAHVRQPLRYGAIDARRDHAGDQPPDRWKRLRGRRLRLVRQGARSTGERDWAPGSSSSRPIPCELWKR